MSCDKGLNLRLVGLVLTLLILAGGIVVSNAISQERLEEARTDIVKVETKFDECVKEIKDDIGEVKIDIAKTQTDVEIIKDNNEYIRGRLDYIIQELAKQNRKL